MSSIQSPRPSESQTKEPARHDRRYTQDRGPDQRSEFERDRDRILYSSALRRLAGVTQVVHVAEGHIFHNRLTHTLKVAQVGRRIAEHILKSEPEELIDAVGGIDPDVVETAALAHDLGHPPFGHIAEEGLDRQLRIADIADGYEGNAQSFRIVTNVAIRHPEHRGLNLTRASLNAVLKYPWERSVDGKEFKKWGCYYSEKEDFQFAREMCSSADRRQSAEAALMDWADDVTYSVHDVDDFYRAGLIPLDRLIVGTDERARFIDFVFDRWAQEDDQTRLHNFNREDASKFFDDLRLWLEELAKGPLEPFSGTRAQWVDLDFLSALLIRRYILGPNSETKAITLVDSSEEPRVRIQPILRAEVDLLKELMRYYVFDNPALVGQQLGQRRVIHELFGIFFDATQPGSKNSSIIPQPFRDSLKEISGPAQRERARLVADIIASMMEQQTLSLYQRLTGLAPGSIRDLIIH